MKAGWEAVRAGLAEGPGRRDGLGDGLSLGGGAGVGDRPATGAARVQPGAVTAPMAPMAPMAQTATARRAGRMPQPYDPGMVA